MTAQEAAKKWKISKWGEQAEHDETRACIDDFEAGYNARGDLKGYDDLVEQIKSAPMTWMPALVAEVIEAAIRKCAFKPGMITTFVEKVRVKHEP